MAQVNVKIGSRDYPIYCEEGEQGKLAEIVDYVNKRFSEIATSSPDITESRLVVLTAMTLANEVIELKKKISPDGTAELQDEDALFANWSQQYEPVIDQMLDSVSHLAKKLQGA